MLVELLVHLGRHVLHRILELVEEPDAQRVLRGGVQVSWSMIGSPSFSGSAQENTWSSPVVGENVSSVVVITSWSLSSVAEVTSEHPDIMPAHHRHHCHPPARRTSRPRSSAT